MQKNPNSTSIKKIRRRPIRVKKIKRKGIKRLRNKFREMSIVPATNNNTYTNPIQFRPLNGAKLISELNAFNKHMRDRYLIGLIHPDIAVRDGLSPKLYHDVPIPTTTYGVYGSYVATTNASGNLLISMATPGQPGVSSPMQHITVNNNAALDGVTSVNGNNLVTVLPIVNVPTQRYRLVSSLIRISYTGPLLNQAGKMYSCATYDPFGISYYNTGVTAQPLVDRFGNFNLIKNGLWNRTVDVTNPSHAIECLWVPTDGYSYIFQQQFGYAGTPQTTTDALMLPTVDGARLGYVIALQGLPASSNCVTVECWTNYELIADPSVAPYMVHSIDNVWNSQSHDAVSNAINNEIKTNGLIREPSKSKSSWSDVISSILDIGAPLLTKLIGLF